MIVADQIVHRGQIVQGGLRPRRSPAQPKQGKYPDPPDKHAAPPCNIPHLSAPASTRNKSSFASFLSRQEESSFSEEKEAKRLLFL
jgi:hypothetical protein